MPVLSAAAEPAYIGVVRDYVETNIKPLIDNPMVTAMLTTQNARTAGLKRIDLESLDRTWRAEARSGNWHLIRQLLSNPLSQLLKAKQRDSQGAITEIFVMDARGLNVAQSTVTADYWQGDEDKYLKTVASSSSGIMIEGAERDESTQCLQTQASFAIDDENDVPIGAVTVTICLDAL
ncbi:MULTISPECIES: hypothetical protein [unclassified Sinorhizobium]|uniref:hypothetical protein n=1 Tax=unclassified Sinorhizobium TaxID=2613772 RepID=UPI00352366E2